jgi:GntR family transcriptional regulator
MNMKLVLKKDYPLGIKDQIKRQIRAKIGSGKLESGKALPSARDMAALLNVNRNTVAAAYRELVAEGLLETVVGSGTYVRECGMIQQTNELKEIFDRAFQAAAASGFSPEQITEFLFTQMAAHLVHSQDRRILVVDCNHETINDISDVLRRELSVQVTGLLIQDLQENVHRTSELLSGVDLIVCGFNHVEEFKAVVPKSPVEVVALLTKPDVHILNEILQLPPGTRLGFICTNKRAAETFYRDIVFSGGSTLTKIWAGMDNPVDFQNMLDQCEVIFASYLVYDEVCRLCGPTKRVIKVKWSIDQANIDLIRQRLSVALPRP